MFELVFLGTSASAPSVHRGLSATAVLAGETRFLVDCGEGTQRQILRSGIGFKRLSNILLTHAHLDHILGLGGLMSTFTRWEENLDELNIWGGKYAIARAEALIFGVALGPGVKTHVPIQMHVIEAGEIYRNDDYSVTAFPVTHRGRGCFGYIFQQKSHFPFLVEKAESLGVPPGPERGKLVRGEAITLADGTVVQPTDVLGDEIKGVKIVFTGDIGRTDNIIEYVQDADALVIEGTFLHEDREMAKAFGHITARQAVTLARDANVRDVFIHHVSRRYREMDIVREAQAVFPTARVVRDLDHYEIRRDQPAKKKEE